MSYVWWSVRASMGAVIGVLEPAGFLCDPRWMTPLDLDDIENACVAIGDRTFVVLRNADDDLDERIAVLDSDFLRLEHDEDNQWSTIIGRQNAAEWSVYGAADSDLLRIEGKPPGAISTLLSAEDELDGVPIAIARQLTGFALDDLPDAARVIRLCRGPVDVELETSPAPPSIVAPPASPSASGPIAVPLDFQGHGLFLLGLLARRGDRLLCKSGGDHIFVVDTTRFPPVFAPLVDHTSGSAAFAPWSTTMLGLTDTNANQLVREVETGRWIRLPFDQLAALRGLDEGVLAFPALGRGRCRSAPDHATRRHTGRRATRRKGRSGSVRGVVRRRFVLARLARRRVSLSRRREPAAGTDSTCQRRGRRIDARSRLAPDRVRRTSRQGRSGWKAHVDPRVH